METTAVGALEVVTRGHESAAADAGAVRAGSCRATGHDRVLERDRRLTQDVAACAGGGVPGDGRVGDGACSAVVEDRAPTGARPAAERGRLVAGEGAVRHREGAAIVEDGPTATEIRAAADAQAVAVERARHDRQRPSVVEVGATSDAAAPARGVVDARCIPGERVAGEVLIDAWAVVIDGAATV